MKRRISGVLLTLAMVLSLLPATAFPALADGPDNFTNLQGLIDGTVAGNTLVLSQDYTAGSGESGLTIDKAITIDLNGYTIYRGLAEPTTEGYVIKVDNNGALTIKDSSSAQTGKITGGNNVRPSSGNTDTNGQGGGVSVLSGGAFTMESGAITGNSALNGGGVYSQTGSTVTITGGALTGNNATSYGGGIYQYGALTLGGTVQITGNLNSTTGRAENLYIPNGKTISLGTGDNAPATEGNKMLVGVTMASAPQGFTAGEAVDYSRLFTSDSERYCVVYEVGRLALANGPTFHFCNGEDDVTSTVPPAAPTWPGSDYTFLGWYDAETGGSLIADNFEYEDDYYAHWKNKWGHTVLTKPLIIDRSSLGSPLIHTGILAEEFGIDYDYSGDVLTVTLNNADINCGDDTAIELGNYTMEVSPFSVVLGEIELVLSGGTQNFASGITANGNLKIISDGSPATLTSGGSGVSTSIMSWGDIAVNNTLLTATGETAGIASGSASMPFINPDPTLTVINSNVTASAATFAASEYEGAHMAIDGYTLVTDRNSAVKVSGRPDGTAAETITPDEQDGSAATYSSTAISGAADVPNMYVSITGLTLPSSSSSGPATYKVNISATENGTVTAKPARAAKGSTVTLTVTPDEGCGVELAVNDKDGNPLDVQHTGDGTYTFLMPRGGAFVDAVFGTNPPEPPAPGNPYRDCPRDENCPIDPFADTENDAWWHDGIHCCLDNGLMNGFPGGLFKPNDPVSRGQLVTILYRVAGEPAFMNDNTFSDVTAGAYYEKAVVWASGKEIVKGYTDGTFGPNSNVTREQLAAILYRCAQFMGVDTDKAMENTNTLSFDDAFTVSDWAAEGMNWCVAVGILNGSNGKLNPRGSATRAQAAAMLQRFCENVLK